LDDLRARAKTDPEAAHQLVQEYRKLPTKQLKALEAKGDATAKAVLDQGYTEPNVVPARPTAGMRQTLTQDLQEYRQKLGVPKSEAAGKTEGGTAGVARTNLAIKQQQPFRAGSPQTGEAKTPEVEKAVKTPFTVQTMQDHAEESLANQVDKAIQDSKLTQAQMEGKTVWILVDQEVCSGCKSGLANPDKAAGVVRQISEKYPNITFEILANATSEVVRVKGGKRLK
jgi:hypothetical protein